jgi:hypothetical protein
MNPPSEIPSPPKPEPEESSISEVGSMFDAFVSLEEIAPDITWSDAIADQWGIPNPPNQAAPKVLDQ